MKIIDAHVHLVQYIAGTGSGGEMRSIGNGKAQYASGEICQMIPKEFNDDKVTPEKIIELMDENQVEKAVLLQGNFFGFQNLYTHEAVLKYPNRFVGAASYDPFSRKKDQIRQHLFEQLNFKIVKFECSTGSGLMANHPTIALNGEVMDECYSYSNQMGHTFVIDIGKCGSESWQIENLREAIKRYPDMKFVVCHLLAANMQQEELMKDGLRRLNLPNVWFDLAAVHHNCGPDTYPYKNARYYLKQAKQIVGAQRLIYGSDIPSVLTKDSYRHLIDYIMEDSDFTLQEKERIFYQNAKQVYFE